MANRLLDKRILMTGGVANIGLAILEAFVAEGATVAVIDIDEKQGLDVQMRFSESVKFFHADLSVEHEIFKTIDNAADWLGGVNTLCLNAGIQLSGHLENFPVSSWDQVFSINVRANFLCIKASLHHLRAAKKSSVMLMSSLAGKRGSSGLSCYSASKAAIIGLAHSLALELAKDGVRVNAVCPGWIDTPFNQPVIDLMGGKDKQNAVIQTVVPLGRQGTPAEVAPLFVYLASDESLYVTAQAINVCGGAYN